MTDDPEWFAPKRYGYGAGWPISWQGWAITLGFVGLLALATLLMPYSTVGYFSAVAILVVTLLVICSRTTRGGWRWRWGQED